ncbi:MAG: hydroxymethylbilane synthase [Candidatus Omnitrophota bacterium]|nr:hydroxymethylbilane synthase [Candidatus Omnitrophota bacterium]
MKNRRVVIGSRSSKLALVQAELVREKLKVFYPALNLEIKTIKTVGDKILDVALSKIGDEGIFTKEIEEALLKGEIDIAVHSMKDLPTQLPQGLKIAAVTEREDPCDVLVSKRGFTLKTLPKGSNVGTSSLRRSAQLLHTRNDLNISDLRGNLDTRVRKLEQGAYDAIILAYAGIKRLGFKLKLSVIPIEEMLPQAGQGALAIEIRGDDREADELVKVLDIPDFHLSINAERALLSGLEGGCQVPIGVYAQVDDDRISVKAGVFSLDGKTAVKDEIAGPKKDAEILGRQLAERILKDKAARQILDEVRKAGI